MPMDYSQLLGTLIEETEENLADMDEALLTLNLSDPDQEKINQIFRAIHTIKGNSTIFKLESIGKLMHTIESSLDKVRKNETSLEKKQVDILLQVSDGIRVILTELKNKKPINEALLAHLLSAFQNISSDTDNQISEPVAMGKQPLKTTKPILSQKLEASHIGWHISIRPKKDIFRRNLDPLKIFKVLQEESVLQQITSITDAVPTLEEKTFEPLQCYLAWELDVQGDISKQRILEILTWVFDEQDITLAKISKKEPSKVLEKKSEPSSTVGKSEGHSGLITSTDEKSLHTLNTLRISTQKIDSLMNAVGELVIIESMLKQSIKKINPKQASVLDEPMDLLDSNFRYLQDILLRIRMVPIAFAINRFPRMVFEMSSKLGKQVDFVIKGEQTEIDKNMIEKMSDPLLHLIRNAIDHGIEFPDEREKKGKNRTGTLQFTAYQEGDGISIEIRDDGAGIDAKKIRSIAIAQGLMNKDENRTDEELYQYIFKPGFSTASQVTEFSGRGVGLDVVEQNIRALGGHVQVHSTPGKGAEFKVRLPLTMAIMDCQLVSVDKQIYIIPLLAIVEMSQIDVNNILMENEKIYYQFKDQKVPVIILETVLHEAASAPELENKIIIIVQESTGYCALICDELLIQQPVVIKTLEENFCNVPGIVGATIMGDGEIGLILDVQEIVGIAKHPETRPIPAANFFSRKFTLSYEPNKCNRQETFMEITKEFLCFALGKSEYAINMAQVKEINVTKTPTYLPFSPPYLAGIINLRGSIVPIVDLRIFFNIKSQEELNKGILIIVNLEKNGVPKTIGLIVDAITDTQSINKQDINPIPKAGQLILSHYIQGLVYINQRIITLLEVQNLVDTTSCS